MKDSAEKRKRIESKKRNWRQHEDKARLFEFFAAHRVQFSVQLSSSLLLKDSKTQKSGNKQQENQDR